MISGLKQLDRRYFSNTLTSFPGEQAILNAECVVTEGREFLCDE